MNRIHALYICNKLQKFLQYQLLVFIKDSVCSILCVRRNTVDTNNLFLIATRGLCGVHIDGDRDRSIWLTCTTVWKCSYCSVSVSASVSVSVNVPLETCFLAKYLLLIISVSLIYHLSNKVITACKI